MSVLGEDGDPRWWRSSCVADVDRQLGSEIKSLSGHREGEAGVDRASAGVWNGRQMAREYEWGD